jgi:hypothetical protein
MQATQLWPGKDHAVTVNEEVLRAHFALAKSFRKVALLQQQSGCPHAYVSGADATGFFGLALAFGASRRTGAAFAAAFLRSK